MDMKFQNNPYQLKKCNNCGDQYPQCVLVQHIETCVNNNQTIICRYCGEQQLRQLILNHLTICKAFELVDKEDGQCEYCQDKIFKKFQQDHYRECTVKKKAEKNQTQKVQECSICLIEIQKSDQKGILQCCHIFHKMCLQEWQKKSKNCPICRHNS
ncbi:unnamed protein product [Paramecium sonneborni]|uniref:RING-type domain-containing protein n=1 Tax=Paramecium sonneborni TaxID=65129 RepID=A0A8S1NFG2_9CILI|nr:unnamed protein product [Paramecium sonneborni]